MIDKLINQGQYSEPLKKVLDLFAHGVVSPITLKETLKPYDTSLDDLHVEAIDAVIDFVNMILCDHVLTKEEMNMLRRLKAFLHIKEGDFIKAQKENRPVELFCAIGDEYIDGRPYCEIVEIAREYIRELGGFEKLAEWGLI